MDIDIPGVPNVEECISRCEVEWFIAGGKVKEAKYSLAARDSGGSAVNT